MASVPTKSPFSSPAAPAPPVLVLLAMSDLPSTTPSSTLLIHTNLPPRPLKRDRSLPRRPLKRDCTPTAPRSTRFDPVARATSTPLSSAAPSFMDGPETPRTTPVPAQVATSPNSGLIPRPKGAQLTVASCNCIPTQDLRSLKDRIKILASEMLNIARPYKQQTPDSLAKFETKILEEFTFLRQYEEHWPLQVLITARLKYSSAESVKMKARKVLAAAAK